MLVERSVARPRASSAIKTRKLLTSAGRLVVWLALLAGVFMTAIPYIYMVSATFKPNTEIFAFPITLWPRNVTTFNYAQLFSEFPFARWFGNSVFVASVRTLLSVFLSALAGFGFAKYKFRGQHVLLVILLATVMLPFQILLVPLFIEMVAFRWLNTYWAVIVPFAANAFHIFLMRQYMLSIPDELLDAARIDGCSEFRIFATIALPIMKPGLAVISILAFVQSWNDFLWPLIVLSDINMFTANLGVATMIGPYRIQYGTIMAGSFLSTLPIIIFFLLMQRQFIAGLTAGAIKL
jgi:ABC-type sugar transport system, permease component